MRTSKLKPDVTNQGAPTIHFPLLPPTPDQIRQHAHEIYMAHGGAQGLALSEWLKAEQDLNGNSKNERSTLATAKTHCTADASGGYKEIQ